MSYETADGIRRSDLWVISKSPLHFKYHMENKDAKKSAALEFGSMVHMLLLEPERFSEQYVVIESEPINRRTKAGREDYDRLMEFCKSINKQPIYQCDFEPIAYMVHAVKDSSAWPLISGGEYEKEFYWTDDVTGEQCKCKVDCVTEYEGKPYIVDYKTVNSCDDGHFERAARKYGYQFQAGMYCEGLFQNTLTEYGFAFVAQEKTPPYAVRVYVCDREWINRGYDKFRELIGIYHECKQTGNWYGYEGPEGLPVQLLEED